LSTDDADPSDLLVDLLDGLLSSHLPGLLGVSERFACRVAGQHRATQRHEAIAATPEDPDAALRAWMRHYAKDHPRRGFRPAYHHARAEGWTVNHNKIRNKQRNRLACI
jgi:hypothetical protein